MFYIKSSGNSKTGKVDAVYSPIANTCPSCPLKDKLCYAQLSFVGFTNTRLEKACAGESAVSVAKQIAAEIDTARKDPKGIKLRLFVSGDSKTIRGSRIINAAVGRFKSRGGGAVWSYTHAWKHVPRDAWSNVSILASVSNIAEADKAFTRGYAPAMVVTEFESERAYTMAGSDIRWIPCPAQTKNVSCDDCGLCMNASRLEDERMGILFLAHGPRAKKFKRSLKVVR